MMSKDAKYDWGRYLPKEGTKLRVIRLVSTDGMIIATHNLTNRRLGNVEYVGPVPGHGGDIWWCRHPEEDIAAYRCWDELEPRDGNS